MAANNNNRKAWHRKMAASKESNGMWQKYGVMAKKLAKKQRQRIMAAA